MLQDLDEACEEILDVVRGAGGGFEVGDALLLGVAPRFGRGDLPLWHVYLISNEDSRDLRCAFRVHDVENVEQFVVDNLDGVERLPVADGEDEDVSIYTNGVLRAEGRGLVLAIRVDDSNVIVNLINKRLPFVGRLKGKHVLRLESVMRALYSQARLADRPRAEEGDAFADVEDGVLWLDRVEVGHCRGGIGGDGGRWRLQVGRAAGVDVCVRLQRGGGGWHAPIGGYRYA